MGEQELEFQCEQEFPEGLTPKETKEAFHALCFSMELYLISCAKASGLYSEEFAQDKEREVKAGYGKYFAGEMK